MINNKELMNRITYVIISLSMIISSCVKDDVKIDLGTSCHEESNRVLITKNTISGDVYYWVYGQVKNGHYQPHSQYSPPAVNHNLLTVI